MRIVYNLLLSLVFLFIMKGCTACSQNTEIDKMTINELEVYFEKNKHAFNSVVDLCIEYPQLHFVDTSRIKILLMSYDDNLTIEMKNAILKIRHTIEEMKFFNIRCNRSGLILDKQLLSVGFSLYSEGLSFGGGYAQSIIFNSKVYRDFRKNKKKLLLGVDYFPLEDDGWFIYIIDDRSSK